MSVGKGFVPVRGGDPSPRGQREEQVGPTRRSDDILTLQRGNGQNLGFYLILDTLLQVQSECLIKSTGGSAIIAGESKVLTYFIKNNV